MQTPSAPDSVLSIVEGFERHLGADHAPKCNEGALPDETTTERQTAAIDREGFIPGLSRARAENRPDQHQVMKLIEASPGDAQS